MPEVAPSTVAELQRGGCPLCSSLFSTGNYDRLARWARLTGKRFGHDDVEALPFMVSNIAHNPEFSKELSSIVLALFSGVRR